MEKRIAFVDRCIDESDAGGNGFLEGRLGRNRKILKGLREKYTVSTYSGFDMEHIEELKKDCLNSGNYDSIITHLPYDDGVDIPLWASWGFRCFGLYGSSLELLKYVHEDFPETKIIVYTGADDKTLPDGIIIEHGASHVLRRIWPIDESGLMGDLERIVEWIEAPLELPQPENEIAKKLNDLDFVLNHADKLKIFMLAYLPKLESYLIGQKPENIGQAINSYFAGIYPEFQGYPWEEDWVKIFVKQVCGAVGDLFPEQKQEIDEWERTCGEDMIQTYLEWKRGIDTSHLLK